MTSSGWPPVEGRAGSGIQRRVLTLADALTITRVGIAAVLVPVVGSSRYGPAGLLLATAWLTDLFDGRLARWAGAHGRWGRWDLLADTLVGVGSLLGLTAAGEIHGLVALATLLILGTIALTGNLAAAMLLQLAGYLPLLTILWMNRPPGWWSPFVVVILIGIIDWRRLLFINIPGFVHALRGSKNPPDSQTRTAPPPT